MDIMSMGGELACHVNYQHLCTTRYRSPAIGVDEGDPELRVRVPRPAFASGEDESPVAHVPYARVAVG